MQLPFIKFLPLALVVTFAIPVLAIAETTTAPGCGAIGSKSEGWYEANGSLMTYGKCAGCTAVCRNAGSKSEGWYDSCSDERIAWTDCNAAFSDVPASHPYAQAIAYVRAQGVVGGYEDGSYRPDDGINRAEFVKILVRANSSEQQIDEFLARADVIDFPDVPSATWYGRYVHFARAMGIIAGYPDGTFRPGNAVNLAEAAKIVINAFGENYAGIGYCESTGECPWWESYVGALRSLNALPLTATKPEKQLTRGEMAQIIYVFMNKQDDSGGSGGSVSTGACRVAGCSGQLCLEEGDDGISTCEWKPAYVCYADATCERQQDGACGWTQTTELRSCLEDANAEMP